MFELFTHSLRHDSVPTCTYIIADHSGILVQREYSSLLIVLFNFPT